MDTCSSCGSTLENCPKCEFEVCPSEPDHFRHFEQCECEHSIDDHNVYLDGSSECMGCKYISNLTGNAICRGFIRKI